MSEIPKEIWIDCKVNGAGYFQVDQFASKKLTSLPINGFNRIKYIRADKNTRTFTVEELEAMRMKMPAKNDCYDAGDNQIPIEIEAYTHGYNALLDKLIGDKQ